MKRCGHRLLVRFAHVQRGQHGQAMVIFALVITALLLIASLAIDIGYARLVQAQAQVAADAAAAAGADVIPGGNAVSTATSMATTNGFTSGGNITVTVNNPPTSGTHKGDTSSVEVIISEKVNTWFAKLGGLNTITAKARAVATAKSTGAACGLCVLSPSATDAFLMNGSGTVTVSGAGVVDDSSASQAFLLNGSGKLVSSTVGVVGKYLVNGSGSVSPTPSTGITVVPDPLAAAPIPSVSGKAQSYVLNGSTNGSISPGIYSSILMNGSGNLTLQAGTYIITGGFTNNGSGNVLGSGVTLYVTCSNYPTPCSSGQSGGYVTMNGSGNYQASAPTSGTLQGMAIFYDRNNTAPLIMNGSGTTNWTGTIYAKSAPMTLNGSGGLAQINSLIVVNTLVENGSGSIDLTFNASQNYPVSTPAGSSNLTE